MLMKKRFGIIIVAGIFMLGCGSNDTAEQQTDSVSIDKLGTDTMATDTMPKDTATAKPGGTGDTSQTAFPSSRKSNTQ